jgi:hypothetical protein
MRAPPNCPCPWQPPSSPPPGLRRLNSLAKKLRAGRVARGALQLASPEVKFELGDDEAHDPIDVGVYQVVTKAGARRRPRAKLSSSRGSGRPRAAHRLLAD